MLTVCIAIVESPRPSIEGSRSAPLYAGTVYNLTCAHQLDSLAFNSSSVEWTVDNSPVNTSSNRISTEDNSLVFSLLATSDAGSYVCLLTLTAAEYVVILNPQQQSLPTDITVEGMHETCHHWYIRIKVMAKGIVTHEASGYVIAYLSIHPQLFHMPHLWIPVYTFSLDLSLSLPLTLDLPAPELTTTSDSQLTVGSQLVLECTVSIAPHLVTQPSLEWVVRDTVLATGTGNSLSHTLTVDKTSAAGVYTCVVGIQVADIGLSATAESQTTLTIQSKSKTNSLVKYGIVIHSVKCYIKYLFSPAVPQPNVTINPDLTGTLYTGSNLTLSCVVTLDPTLVDTPTDVIITWAGPRSIPGEWYAVTDTTANGSEFSSNLSIAPLAEGRDEGDYTCSAAVSGGDHIIRADSSSSITLDITSESEQPLMNIHCIIQ